MEHASAARITGTTSPSSTATAIPMSTDADMLSPSGDHRDRMRGWRATMRADTATSTSVRVTGVVPRPLQASFQPSIPEASISRWRKKCGASRQLSLSRSAILPQILECGSKPGSPVSSLLPRPTSTAARTSEARTAPRGPVPLSAARSTPCAAATRRAFGDALGRNRLPPERGGAGTATAGGWAAGSARVAVAAAGAARAISSTAS